MKLSALIKKLQAIESEVPFDSEVVTGDDFMPSQISAVFHEPPYTFIQFESMDDEDLDIPVQLLTFERMVELSSQMTVDEKEELASWERQFIIGDGAYGTSDWPGWHKLIERLSH